MYMNTVVETIKTRRCVRKYKPDMVPDELIQQVIEAGLYAPSGMGKQDTIIVAVKNKEIRDKLAKANAKLLGLGSCWIHRAKEEFDMPEWKELLDQLGVEGEYEGVGHCILGYVDGEEPEAAERKENRVYFVR